MTLSNDERTLMEWVAGQRDALIARTAELVRIPTVNPYSGDASAANEAAGQEVMVRLFRAMGGRVTRVPVPPDVYDRIGMVGPRDRRWDGRENVVAEWTLGDGNGPTVLLNTHIDTVGTAGMAGDPFDPVVRDGRLYGRGSSDSKGNLAVGLTAVEAMLRGDEALHGRILFESVVDEECNGSGAGTIACCLAGVRGDFSICLDGPRGIVQNGCNGIVTARMLVRGQSGHGAASGTVNAIDKGIAARQAVAAFAAEHERAWPDCHVTLGVFRAGTHPASVPGVAELQANVLYPLCEAEAAFRERGQWNGVRVRERFEAALRALARQDAWFEEHPVEVLWIKDVYPFRCDPAHPFLQRAAACACTAWGESIPVEPMRAWGDISHLARLLDAPVAGMGAAAPGCPHADAEYVVVDDLVRDAQAVALTLRRTLHRA